MSAKHTTGPWHIYERGDELTILGERKNHTWRGSKDTWEVCHIDNGVMWDEPGIEDIDRANLRLICAAPELLEALRRLEQAIRILPPEMDQSGSALDEARKAIDKAEGRS